MNSTRPINQLPAEVLGHIFSFLPYRRKYPILDTVTPNVKYLTHLAPVFYACRRWRMVVLQSSFLWDTVITLPAANHPRTQNYLALCANRPIYVVAYIDGSPNSLPLHLLREHGGRVRELYVKHNNPETEQLDASALLQLSLPALERCMINGCSDSPSTEIRLFPDSAALRVLQIARGGIHFASSTNFPALTVLHLTKIAHVHLLDLLTFLSGTPCLQDLHLDLLSPMTLDATQWRNGRVQLRVLERLAIHEETTETSGDEPSNPLAECRRGLLSNISVPPACALAVDGVMGVDLISDLLRSLWPSPGRCATHIHLLAKHIPPWERSHRQRRQFVVHLNGEDGLDASFGVVEHADADADPSGDTARSRLASALSVGPVFRTFHKLLIANKLKWLRQDLRWIITALPCIDSVIVHGKVEDHSRLLAFIKALEVAPDATVPVPSLSTLVLNGGTCSIADPPDTCGIRGEGAIFEVQRSRAAAGRPLQRLAFALGDTSYEYDADGVLARVDAWPTILQEFEDKWALEIGHRRHIHEVLTYRGCYDVVLPK